MTHAEVFREIDRDFPNLKRWTDHRQVDFYRSSLKVPRRQYPIEREYIYRSPRFITYHVYMFAQTRDIAKNAYCCAYVERMDPMGRELFMCDTYEQVRGPRVVMLQHLLDRYAERMELTLTGHELVRHFLFSTNRTLSSFDQLSFARSVRYKGELLMAMCSKVGAILGVRHEEVFVAKTFITYDMMEGRQREELAPLRDMLESGVTPAALRCLRFNNRRSIRTNNPLTKI